MKITEGKAAPAFTLPDQLGHSASLKTLADQFTVIYFYPKDDTPGCTIEAKEFSSKLREFEKVGAQVVGISGGDEKSKTKFCTKHQLKVKLLSDTDFTVSKKYGAYGKKSFMGRSYMGILRKTFIVDSNKRVVKVYESVKPEGHAEEVLDFISRATSRQGVLPLKAPGKKQPKRKSVKTKSKREPAKKAKTVKSDKRVQRKS